MPIATSNEMQIAVGCTAAWAPGGGVQVHVRIVDMRQRFGRFDAQIEPVAGSGQRWVDVAVLTLLPAPVRSGELASAPVLRGPA